jgi:hypothetical protein
MVVRSASGERMFSDSELARARTRDWDPRVAAALGHSVEYGGAEYLAGQLMVSDDVAGFPEVKVNALIARSAELSSDAIQHTTGTGRLAGARIQIGRVRILGAS